MPFGPSGRRRWRLYDSSRCRREEKAMGRRVKFRSDMRPDFRPSDEDLRYALRWAFGSREEMNEMFRELEAKMVEDMHRIAEEAKRKRDAEWPLPPEDESQSDVTAAPCPS